nr:cystathionine gamma-synthase 1, chloroplastic [Ipomoea batatas]
MKLSVSLLLKTFSLRLQMASSWRRHHLHWAFYSQAKNAAYLIIRGMKTLHLRVQQQNSTALRMAEVLEIHPKEIIGSACIFIALHRSMTSSWTFNPHATKVYAFHDKLEIRPLCQEM